MNLNEFTFTTDANYLKRAIKGTRTFTIPTSGVGQTITINHNLGYKPQYFIGIDTAASSRIWTGGIVLSERTDAGILSGLGSTPTYPDVTSYVTNTQLVVRIDNASSTSAGSKTLHYIIYLDYKT